MKKPIIVKYQNVTCPHCQFVYDQAGMMSTTAPKGAKPQTGSVVICVECGEFCKIAQDGSLRKVTDGEMIRISQAPYFDKALADSIFIKAKRN